MLDCESLGAAAFEMVEDLRKISLSFAMVEGYEVKEAVIEGVVPEEDSSAGAQYILLVADETVAP